MNPKLSVPDDFAERADRTTNADLMAHYGVSVGVIGRWRRETGARPPRPRRGRPFVATPMPDGFALVAPTMTVRQLRERYGRGQAVIGRWLAEAGVEARKPATRTGGAFPLIFTRRDHRDDTSAGRAADFLRRFGPVFRCWANGAAHRKGDHWNRNGFVLADADLIARAVRLGWREDAWKELAA